MRGLPIHRIGAPPAVFLQPFLELDESGFLCFGEVIEDTSLRVCCRCPRQGGLTTINVVRAFLRLRRAGPSSDELSSHGCFER